MECPVLRIEVSSTSLRMEFPMSGTNTTSPLRQRMLEDMAARKLNPHTQRSHVYSCKRFAAWLKRSPDTATPRARQPRPIEGDGCDRALSHGGARWACRTLRERGVRPYGDRVQLLPQPALPEVQGAASRRWLAEREAELLPVPYFHVVYTLPSELRDIAYQNKRMVYDLLMKAAADRPAQASLTLRPAGSLSHLSDLCHEAPALPVTRPSRSSASGSIDNSPGGIFLH